MLLHRLSWGLFVVIGALGTLMGTRSLFDPASLPTMLGAIAPGAEALATPETQELGAFLSRWVGVALIGQNLFTIAIAVTSLRRGERWACLLMLYWPLMFASHFFMYEPGPMRFVQIGWLCLTIPALAFLLLRSSSQKTSSSTP